MTFLVHKIVSFWMKTSGVNKDYFVRHFFHGSIISTLSKEFRKRDTNFYSITLVKCYSDKPFISKVKDTTEEGKKQAEKDKKKKSLIPKITLVDPNDNLSVTTLQEAAKIAKRRDLKLLFVREDPKSGRAEYKMISNADYVKANTLTDLESPEKTKSAKKEKLLMISSKIAEHDLNSKIKQLSKWLDKRYEIRVCITDESNRSNRLEEIYNTMEHELKAKGRFVQKRLKINDLKFQILPPKE